MIPIQDVVPTGRTPWATLALMLTSVVVFVATSARPALLDVSVLAPFSHPSLPQLVVGLLYLWLFGDNVEARLGRPVFVAGFAVCGTLAAFTSLQLDARGAVIGGAGAITGLLGAYLVLLPASRVLLLVPVPLSLIEVPAGFFVGLWWVLQLMAFVLLPAAARSPSASLAPVWALIVSFLFGVLVARLAARRVVWRTIRDA